MARISADDYYEHHESKESLREGAAQGPSIHYCIMRQVECDHAHTYCLKEYWGDDYETSCSYGDDEGDDDCLFDEDKGDGTAT